MHLGKSDMQDNAAMFGEGLSSSLSKKAMALRLSEIYIKNTTALLPMLSLSSAVYLHLIFKSDTNGQLTVLNESVDEKYTPFNALHKQLEYLGLIDYCGNQFYVADILQAAVSDIDIDHLDARLIVWQQMEACALGIIAAYGMLEEDVFYRIFHACYPNLRQEDTTVFLKRRLAVTAGCRCYPVMGTMWRLSKLIDDPDSWYSLLKSKEALPHQNYTRDAYLEFSANGLAKKPEHFNTLADILTDTGMSFHDAEEMLWCMAIDQCCQLNAHSQIPHMMMKLLKNSPVKATQIMRLCAEFENDIPRWINKGHTTQQLCQITSLLGGHTRYNRTVCTEPDKSPARNRNVVSLKAVVVSRQRAGRKAP